MSAQQKNLVPSRVIATNCQDRAAAKVVDGTSGNVPRSRRFKRRVKKENVMSRRSKLWCGLSLPLVTFASIGATSAYAQNDIWSVRMAVDNQYTAYFGTATATTGVVGSAADWTNAQSWTVPNRSSSDYFYISTSSDHSGYQGFLGILENVTQSTSIQTGSPLWQVFPAGKYAAVLGNPSPWPVMQMPTQSQVDSAIRHATDNGLWEATDGFAGWDNDPTTPAPAPYTVDAWASGTFYPNRYLSQGIPTSTQWVWHDSTPGNTGGGTPDPFIGANHDEFLVFRVVGVPEPTSLAAVVGAGSLLIRRRRR